MRDTWYVLEDGSVADPRDVAPDESGRLVHASGIAVAYSNGVPRSRGVDIGEDRKPAAPAPERKDLKPETAKRAYKTRESKSE